MVAWRGALLSLLSVCLSQSLGCGKPCAVIGLRFTGATDASVGVRVSATFPGRAASQVVDFGPDATHPALRVPPEETGTLSIYAEALSADGCVIARGTAILDLAACQQDDAEIALQPLAHPLCDCTDDGWCREYPEAPNHDL